MNELELRVVVFDTFYRTWNTTSANFSDRASVARHPKIEVPVGMANRKAKNNMEYKKFRMVVNSAAANPNEPGTELGAEEDGEPAREPLQFFTTPVHRIEYVEFTEDGEMSPYPVDVSNFFDVFSSKLETKVTKGRFPEMPLSEEYGSVIAYLAAAKDLKRMYLGQLCCVVTQDLKLLHFEYPFNPYEEGSSLDMSSWKTHPKTYTQLKKGDILLVSQDQGSLRDLYAIPEDRRRQLEGGESYDQGDAVNQTAVGWVGNGLAYPHRTSFRPVTPDQCHTGCT